MRGLRIALCVGLVMAATAAFALPAYLTVFTNTYKPRAGSALAKASCVTCHTSASGGALNPYGAAILKVKGKGKPMTAAVLHKVDSLDSDKDGVKNIDEIKAGTLPGDAKSKPGAVKKPGRKHTMPSTKKHTRG